MCPLRVDFERKVMAFAHYWPCCINLLAMFLCLLPWGTVYSTACRHQPCWSSTKQVPVALSLCLGECFSGVLCRGVCFCDSRLAPSHPLSRRSMFWRRASIYHLYVRKQVFSFVIDRSAFLPKFGFLARSSRTWNHLLGAMRASFYQCIRSVLQSAPGFPMNCLVLRPAWRLQT